MAASEMMAVGNTAATTTDFALSDNTAVVFGLKGVTAPRARVYVDVKDDAGGWNSTPAMVMTSDQPFFVFGSVPSTIRFRREAGGTCGVYRAA